jgi:hypothetical protein
MTMPTFVFSLALVAAVCASLDPTRVRLIATHGANFFFRGNLPQADDGTFAFGWRLSPLFYILFFTIFLSFFFCFASSFFSEVTKLSSVFFFRATNGRFSCIWSI